MLSDHDVAVILADDVMGVLDAVNRHQGRPA